MSQKSLTISNLNGSKTKVAIIYTIFNEDLVMPLLTNTTETLINLKVLKKNISTYRVPGAMELPFACNKIALAKKHHVIIALGVVIKGKTAHFEHVCRTATDGCLRVSLDTKIPIINGVLTVNNIKQAEERVSNKKMNKGREFAESALLMADFNS